MLKLRTRFDYFSTNELWKRCDGKTLLKAAAVAQRCGTTLKRLPPSFPLVGKPNATNTEATHFIPVVTTNRERLQRFCNVLSAKFRSARSKPPC